MIDYEFALYVLLVLIVPPAALVFMVAFFWGWRRIGKVAALIGLVAVAWLAATTFLPPKLGKAQSFLVAGLVTFGGAKLWNAANRKWPGVMARKARAWRWGLVMTAVGCVSVVTYELNRTEVDRVYMSPKGRYRLVVLRPAVLLPYEAMGFLAPYRHGIVIPGSVRLYDQQGKLCGKVNLDTLSGFEEVEPIWSDDGDSETVSMIGPGEFLFKVPRE